MREEKSCGVIPLRQGELGELRVLIVVHKGGKHWGFPKGRQDPEETDQETASRELEEETGLIVSRFMKDTPYEECYTFYRGKTRVHKKVCYFPCLVQGELRLQPEEILEACWL
ncbi:MAG: NUDIX domain-containing protein, partial [Chlamydiae bacterium]|nr:NUDIX domain-containing protein [Chlamydiota bacterium]